MKARLQLKPCLYLLPLFHLHFLKKKKKSLAQVLLSESLFLGNLTQGRIRGSSNSLTFPTLSLLTSLLQGTDHSGDNWENFLSLGPTAFMKPIRGRNTFHKFSFIFWSGFRTTQSLSVELLISVFSQLEQFFYSNFLLLNFSSVISRCLYWGYGALEISLRTGPVQFNPKAS